METAAERHVLWGSQSKPELDAVVRRVQLGLGAPIALLTFVGKFRQNHVARAVSGPVDPYRTDRFVPVGYSFCQHVVALDRALAIEDAWIHPLVKDSPAVREAGLTAYLGAPIHSRQGDTLGALCVADLMVRRWSDREIRFLKAMAKLTEPRIARTEAEGGRR